MSRLVVAAPAPASLLIVGEAARFPVHRIFCVGRNYADHAREMGFTGREPPFFFMKPASAVLPVAAGETGRMAYPTLTQDLHHEVELVACLGVGGSDIDAASALAHVYGYAVGLDMTRRDLQGEQKAQGRPWEIGKAFDESAPIGPVTPLAAAGAIGAAEIRLAVNGELRQKGAIAAMIWTVAETIAILSRAWALQPGDLIFTGTPQGVAAVGPGDRLVASVTGLENLAIEIR